MMEFALETANRMYYQSEQLEISSAVTRTEHYPASVCSLTPLWCNYPWRFYALCKAITPAMP
jgi:hypothetical protein